MDVLACDKLKELKATGAVLDVVVKGITNAGVIAYVEDVRGFIPASKLSLEYVEDTEENILYLQSKASMLKFMKMNETFTNGDCEYKVTDVIATTYRDYAYELVNDEYTEGMMDYLKKIRNVDDNGYLTDKEYRFIWVKLNIKYNGRSSTKLNMSTSLYVKKNDKLVSYGSYLIESKELWLLPDSEEKVAGRVAVNPGEEMDMWICFKAKYNSGYTYYMTGSFGYNDDPRLYTGNLIELNIEDKE